MKTPIPRPTESELSILRILWDHGPAPVRTVAEELSADRGEEVGYTTALKLLQLMHEKGLVHRDETERSHRYAAVHPPAQVRWQALKNLSDKLFGGAPAELAMHALSHQKASPEDLQKIRELLDTLESQQKGE
ncbi:MAG: BlaI/MecI/CopY family transcriptional regulator [Verrucomicrobiae bacterium]|nr:BlaI/MecI/CopY family transcriptional regulator [Verrucomicrobiae bacterium]